MEKIKSYHYFSDSQKLSAKELSNFLKVSKVTIWRWSKIGMPNHKTRGVRYFVLSEVLDWLKNQPLQWEIYVKAKIDLDFRKPVC